MWQFARHELDTQEAVSLWRLGDRLVITDGHTRALAAWLMGRDRIIARWETEPLDWEAYRICVHWCEESGIRSVPDLTGRVLNAADFRRLWLDRCLQMQSQLHKERTKRRAVPESPIIYRQPVSDLPTANHADADFSEEAALSPLSADVAIADANADELTLPLAEPSVSAATQSETPTDADAASSQPASPTTSAFPSRKSAITQAMLDDEMTLPLMDLPPGVMHGVQAASSSSASSAHQVSPNYGQPNLENAPPNNTQSVSPTQVPRASSPGANPTPQPPPRPSRGRERFEQEDMTLPLQDLSFEARNSGKPFPTSPSPSKRQRLTGQSSSQSKNLSTNPAQRVVSNKKTHSSASATRAEQARPVTAINWSYDEDQTIIDTPQTKINPKSAEEPPATDAPSTSIHAQSQS